MLKGHLPRVTYHQVHYTKIIGPHTYRKLWGGEMGPDPGTVCHRKLYESVRSEFGSQEQAGRLFLVHPSGWPCSVRLVGFDLQP